LKLKRKNCGKKAYNQALKDLKTFESRKGGQKTGKGDQGREERRAPKNIACLVHIKTPVFGGKKRGMQGMA